MSLEKERKQFCAELEITESRADELVKIVHGIYYGKESTVLSLMFKCREYATTAKEDMFVCYLVGFIHASEINRPNVHVIDLRK